MTVLIWIVIGVLGVIAAFVALQAILGFAVPIRVSGAQLLKQELRKNWVRSDNLPAEFYEGCVIWAQHASGMVVDLRTSSLAKKAEFVRTIESIAQMAALWIAEPDSPMFKSWGAGENGYRALFAKYDLKATG
jgi:hypothetical protein